MLPGVGSHPGDRPADGPGPDASSDDGPVAGTADPTGGSPRPTAAAGPGPGPGPAGRVARTRAWHPPVPLRIL